MVYTGRFAPSPTGPLHFGSLLAALASYLDARSNQGIWLVRIEDLDPPREVAGATDSILRTLAQFGLNWDREVIYQSRRQNRYREVITQLLAQEEAYYCSCSRQEIRLRSRSGLYDGFCRHHSPVPERQYAVRDCWNTEHPFSDRILGYQSFPDQMEDFVIFRRDGLYAYQLAVTVDDAEQNISHIVRGSDLLDSTPKQINLQQQLGYLQPEYAHIPVATNNQGQKLSKQTFATALDSTRPQQQLIQALQFLGQCPPEEMTDGTTEEILSWAINNWKINNVPACMGIELKDN